MRRINVRPAGSRLTRTSRVKVASMSYQPMGTAAAGWLNYLNDPVPQRLASIAATGVNATKRNCQGFGGGPSDPFPSLQLTQIYLKDWVSHLRANGLKWYLNCGYANVVFGPDGTAAEKNANLAAHLAVLSIIMDLAWDLVLAEDVCNEFSGNNTPTSWGGSAQGTQAQADMRWWVESIRAAFPALPLSASVYTDATSWSDVQWALKFQSSLGLDFHDVHDYRGLGYLGATVAQAPAPAEWQTFLENQSWFIGRHFSGECGILNLNSSAAITAWYEGLAAIHNMDRSLGGNAFSDQNFTAPNSGGLYGIAAGANPAAAQVIGSLWPKGL